MAKFLTKYRKAARGRRLIQILAAVLVLLVAGIIAITGGTIAKYIRKTSHGTVAKAPELYFTSNYLGGKTTAYTLAEGESSFTFVLRNYEGPDESNDPDGDGVKVSQMDFKYEVTITSDKTGYSVTNSEPNKQFTKNHKGIHTVTISDLKPGEYNVTATVKDAYARTLTAKVIVTGSNGVYKNTKVYPDYVLLTVWTDDQTASVTIKPPATLIPDGTDPDLTGKAIGAEISLTLGKNESRAYRFFTTSAYNNEAIPVVYGSNELKETTLD